MIDSGIYGDMGLPDHGDILGAVVDIQTRKSGNR